VCVPVFRVSLIYSRVERLGLQQLVPGYVLYTPFPFTVLVQHEMRFLSKYSPFHPFHCRLLLPTLCPLTFFSKAEPLFSDRINSQCFFFLIFDSAFRPFSCDRPCLHYLSWPLPGAIFLFARFFPFLSCRLLSYRTISFKLFWELKMQETFKSDLLSFSGPILSAWRVIFSLLTLSSLTHSRF